MNYKKEVNEAVALLKQLIAIPSVSREEEKAADLMQNALEKYGLPTCREGNNIWVMSEGWDNNKPTIMLNAHIDTVKPVATWTRNPHKPEIEGDRLYGLGSNDCGGGLVSLMQVFRLLTQKDYLPYNLIYLASCEEEVSGAGGIRSVFPKLPKVDVAIVGEPTGMQPAVAERGLMVIDAVAHGKSGHAARNEGVNAIYEALDDLVFIRDYKFDKVSPLLGPTKMQCTVVNSGTQHNVVPDECRFIIDVRTNENHKNEDVFEFLQTKLKSDLKARSFHLHSSSIPMEHPLIQRCIEMGLEPYGSPTLSDQALMRFPSFKMGPGASARSHAADEYICISEIEDAISKYMELLS